MEIIKKRICLEDFISRTPIPTNNLPVVNTGATNSWGEIPSYLINYKGEGIKYNTFMDYYKQLEGLVNNPTLINETAITTSIGEIPISSVTDELKEIYLFINKHYTPSDIKGAFVPSYIYYSQQESILKLLDKIKPSENNLNCCTIRNYNEYGGDDFYGWVSGLTLSATTSISASTSANTIDIPILLTSKINDLGQYRTYDVTIESGDTEVEIETNPNTIPISRVIETSGESKLKTLRKRKKNYDDLGNELPDMLSYSASTSIDLEIGYVTGYTKNIQIINNKFYGDLITNITPSPSAITSGDTEVTFTYVLGGKLNENYNGINTDETPLFNEDVEVGNTGTTCGIWYQETFPIITGSTTCDINNSSVTINYTAIDFGSKETTINYEGIDFPRKNYILCENIRYISDSYSNYTTKHFIFKDEKMMSLNYPLKEEYDVVIDRGSSSAFERHLQLSEIKTWQDLENYRNGSLLNN